MGSIYFFKRITIWNYVITLDARAKNQADNFLWRTYYISSVDRNFNLRMTSCTVKTEKMILMNKLFRYAYCSTTSYGFNLDPLDLPGCKRRDAAPRAHPAFLNDPFVRMSLGSVGGGRLLKCVCRGFLASKDRDGAGVFDPVAQEAPRDISKGSCCLLQFNVLHSVALIILQHSSWSSWDTCNGYNFSVR